MTMAKRVTEVTLRIVWDDDEVGHPCEWVFYDLLDTLPDDAQVVKYEDIDTYPEGK